MLIGRFVPIGVCVAVACAVAVELGVDVAVAVAIGVELTGVIVVLGVMTGFTMPLEFEPPFPCPLLKFGG